jgi:hypothetical protein
LTDTGPVYDNPAVAKWYIPIDAQIPAGHAFFSAARTRVDGSRRVA